MRIRIQEEKTGEDKKKKARKLVPVSGTGSNCNFIKILSKFGPAPWFFLILNNLFCLFQLQKTLHNVIFTNFFKAESGSALKKQLDPDPHCEKQLDPDPHKMNVDLKALDKRMGTQHCT